jgi:integrase
VIAAVAMVFHCVALARQMEKGRTAQDRTTELPYFTVAQMAAIVNSAKTQLNRALFALAAGTGARAGELFALRVETDVNLNEQTITTTWLF